LDVWRLYAVVFQEVLRLSPFQVCQNSREHGKASTPILY
jgi:hypothetical protein